MQGRRGPTRSPARPLAARAPPPDRPTAREATRPPDRPPCRTKALCDPPHDRATDRLSPAEPPDRGDPGADQSTLPKASGTQRCLTMVLERRARARMLWRKRARSCRERCACRTRARAEAAHKTGSTCARARAAVAVAAAGRPIFRVTLAHAPQRPHHLDLRAATPNRSARGLVILPPPGGAPATEHSAPHPSTPPPHKRAKSGMPPNRGLATSHQTCSSRPQDCLNCLWPYSDQA